METFKVELTKTYIIEIKAENKNLAKELSEFYTGDIQDISIKDDQKSNNFEIISIVNKINEATFVEKINETN